MDTSPRARQLEQLLSASASELVARQDLEFDRHVSLTGESYVLFGAGPLGRITSKNLRKAGIEPLAFVDNNPRLWNTLVEGAKVFSPQDAADRFAAKATFVVTIYTSQPVFDQLASLGIAAVSFAALAWRYPHAFLPFCCVDLPQTIFDCAPDVRAAFSIWADDLSRAEYVGQLQWRATLDRFALPPHLPQQDMYFPADLATANPEEVLVDCGAFDGDTVRQFIGRSNSNFRKIIAIEPDPANCESLASYVSSLPGEMRNRVVLLRSAVGSRRERISFDATGTVESSVGIGSYEVECAPLDELVMQYAPTFIKMDIEGAEPDALEGARRAIQQFKPVLFVCLYHRQEHPWQVPLLIRSLSTEHALFLRRYSDECWELACIAVPRNRLPSVTTD